MTEDSNKKLHVRHIGMAVYLEITTGKQGVPGRDDENRAGFWFETDLTDEQVKLGYQNRIPSVPFSTVVDTNIRYVQLKKTI